MTRSSDFHHDERSSASCAIGESKPAWYKAVCALACMSKLTTIMWILVATDSTYVRYHSIVDPFGHGALGPGPTEPKGGATGVVLHVKPRRGVRVIVTRCVSAT